MKYLFLSAHCDDHELSCGGAIQILKDQGHDVYCQALSWCNNANLLTEFENANDILGVSPLMRRVNAFKVREFTRQKIADFFFTIKDSYDGVYTHSPNDRHDDHRIVGEQAKRVLNCSLISFMCPFNGELNPNYFVQLSEEQLEKKIQALECYESQRYRSYMSPDFIRAQARYNGVKCGVMYAESFKVEKLIV